MGTLSGAEQISQSCRQSIKFPCRDGACYVYLTIIRTAATQDVPSHVSTDELVILLPPSDRAVVCRLRPRASLAPVLRCRHLCVHARSAQSSISKPRSEFRCSAKCKTA